MSEPRDVTAKFLSVLMSRRKAQLSRRRMLKKTEVDLGKDSGLNPRDRSKINLQKIKQRLKDCNLLPEHERAALHAELKQQHTFLTASETELYRTLLDYKYFIYHTGIALVFQELLTVPTPILVDPAEAKRRNIAIKKTATPEFCGAEHNIYFNLGTEHTSLPQFTRLRRDNETNRLLDYTTVKADFTTMMRETPHLLRGAWSSGHFAHYQSDTRPMAMPAIILGSTEFYWQHEVAQSFSSQQKKYNKIYHFHRADGASIQLKIEIGDELAFQQDIFSFVALSFIERLRYVGGEVRQNLLKTLDEKLIDHLIGVFFRADDFEIHVPTQFPLHNPQVQIISPQDRKRMTVAMSEAARVGDIENLAALNKRGVPIDGYMYEDSYQFDSSGPTPLPMVAAIQSSQMLVIRWLITHGANSRIFINTGKENLYGTADSNLWSSSELIAVLTAAIESKDPSTLRLLLQNGLDINHFQRSELKKMLHHKASTQKLLTRLSRSDHTQEQQKRLKKTDLIFIAIITVCSRVGSTEALDILIPQLEYCKSLEFYSQVFEDLAMVGSAPVFCYFLEKAPLSVVQTLSYHKLFSIAVESGNDALLDFLDRARARQETTETKEEPETIKTQAMAAYAQGHVKIGNWLLHKHRIPLSEMHSKLSHILANHNLSEDHYTNIVKWLVEECHYPVTTSKFDSGRWNTAKITVVEYCVKNKHLAAAKYLIETCYQGLSQADDKLRSNLVSMALLDCGDTLFAEYLLSNGCLLDELDKLLLEAVKKGHEQVVAWLLARGTRPSSAAVENALVGKSLSIIKLLEQAGARFPERTKDARSLEQFQKLQVKMSRLARAKPQTIKNLFSSTENTFIEQMVILINDVKLFRQAVLSANADVLEWLNERYTFAPALCLKELLALVVQVGDETLLEKINWLATHGMDLQQVDDEGHCFVERILTREVSFEYDHLLLQIAEDQGVVLAPFLAQYGGAMLVRAIQAHTLSGRWEVINWLLNHGVNANAIYEYGIEQYPQIAFLRGEKQKLKITPLEAACGTGDVKLVKALLEIGAHPNLCSQEDSNCLHVACGQSKGNQFSLFSAPAINAELIVLLCQHGANTNYGKYSPLTLLCMQDNIDLKLMEQLLKDFRADPNYGEEITALMRLVSSERIQVEAFTLLLKYGAKIDVKMPGTELTIREYIDQNRREYIRLLEAPEEKQEAHVVKQPKVFISTRSTQRAYNVTDTGDVDYAQTMQKICVEQDVDATYLDDKIENEEDLYIDLLRSTLPKQETVLHIMVNAPFIGNFHTIPGLQKFKSMGGKIVVTIVEFNKHTSRQDKHALKQQSIDYANIADRVIFLDEKDKESAEQFSGRKWPHCRVINVPATINVPALPNTGGDILSFGMIRKGKGYAHIIKLADLIKHSDNPAMIGKKIHVVGSVTNVQEDRLDPSLSKLMCAVYPQKRSEIDGKTPRQLTELLQLYKRDPMVIPQLPIEIHCNVPKDQLPEIFSRCRYSYLPAYRGATLRNTSISTSLAYQFITYVHEGLIAPTCIKPGGAHQHALILIPHKTSGFYAHAAESVFADIQRREQNADLNIRTQESARRLVCEELSVAAIGKKLVELFTELMPAMVAAVQRKFFFSDDQTAAHHHHRETSELATSSTSRAFNGVVATTAKTC